MSAVWSFAFYSANAEEALKEAEQFGDDALVLFTGISKIEVAKFGNSQYNKGKNFRILSKQKGNRQLLTEGAKPFDFMREK